MSVVRASWKKARRVGVQLYNTDKNPLLKRNFPPGVHGPKGRGRLTEYGRQLMEKQKARFMYGIVERQFSKYFREAKRRRGDTSKFLYQLLETRLDNTVFRGGLGKTRSQARQLVTHGHFLVNGKKVNIPSYTVQVGDVITVRPKSEKSKFFADVQPKQNKVETPSWVSVDSAQQQVKVLALPNLEQEQSLIDYKLIVEFYSRLQ